MSAFSVKCLDPWMVILPLVYTICSTHISRIKSITQILYWYNYTLLHNVLPHSHLTHSIAWLYTYTYRPSLYTNQSINISYPAFIVTFIITTRTSMGRFSDMAPQRLFHLHCSFFHAQQMRRSRKDSTGLKIIARKSHMSVSQTHAATSMQCLLVPTLTSRLTAPTFNLNRK